MLSEGLQVTVIGIVTVFAVLIILMIVMMIMKSVFYSEPKKASVKKEIEPKTDDGLDEVDSSDEDELIAVLTAAIASSLNQSTYNLKIKSFRRIEDNTPIWNKVSRNEQINKRL